MGDQLTKRERALLEGQLRSCRAELSKMQQHMKELEQSHAAYTCQTREMLESVHPPTETNHPVPPMPPIGYLHLVQESHNMNATLQVTWGTNARHTLDGLEDFSHIWLLFRESKGFTVGDLAPQPNSLGLSLCQLDQIVDDTLYLSHVRIPADSPILDIKPYIPVFDNPNQHVLVRPHGFPV